MNRQVPVAIEPMTPQDAALTDREPLWQTSWTSEYLADENGRVRAMRLQRMELGEPDASGRRSPVPVEGDIVEVPVDEVIVSVGVSPNPLIPSTIPGLETTRRGTIVADEATLETTVPMLFAGGDIVRGGATVILAMGDGRRAAAAMDRALSQHDI